MKFHHELTYDAPVAEVYAMLSESSFRERVCDAMRTTRYDVSIKSQGEGMEVTVDQTQPAHGIPSFAKKFVGDEIQIVQDERWSNPQQATLELAIPGKPGHLKGGITLAENGSGTVETVTGEVKVNIPLVGGKLEGLVAQLLVDALDTEQRVGRAWLAGDR
jgi:hypothetical protein